MVKTNPHKARQVVTSGTGGVRLSKTAPPKPVDLSGWLDRNQAADLLGVTVQTIYNLERRGKLHAARDLRIDNSGAQRNMWVYDPREVAKVPASARGHIRAPGETAARTFEMLDEGKSVREIVIELREMPVFIEELKEKWKDSGGADLVINPAAYERITQLVGKFKTVTELVVRLEQNAAIVAAAQQKLDAK